MSALIRLYPAAWRERYEDEFLALLEARPPTVGDRFDIVRGAIDARLHPQVRRSGEQPIAPAPVPDQRVADLVVARRLGIAALVGGALWGLSWVVAINGPLVNDGGSTYRDGGAAMPLFLLAIALLIGGLTGQLIWLPASARLARSGAVIAILFLILWAFGPWVLFTVVGWLIGLTVLAVGAARAGRWPLPASFALLATCVGFVAIGFVAAGLVEVPQVVGELLMFAVGFPMWLVVGGTLVTGAVPARLRPA